MNSPTAQATKSRLASTALLFAALMALGNAWAQPSNRPLLTNQAGAKPNLMIALDNSGSMAFPFDETYGLLYSDNNNNALLFCQGVRAFANTRVGSIANGRVDPSIPNNQRCFGVNALNADGTPNFNSGWNYLGQPGFPGNPNGVAYVPALTARNNMLAQRSADINPVYYNPRTTYAPRVDASYANLPLPVNPRFVSNQTSHAPANVFYTVYRKPDNPNRGTLYTVNVQKPAAPAPVWATAANIVYSLRVSTPFPVHLEYNTDGSVATPAFTYTYCRDAAGASTVQRDTAGVAYGCSSVRRTPFDTSPAGSFVSVFAPGHPSAAGNIITLPADHSRTDCGANATTCTNQQELDNIRRWYHWYSTRQLATSTAIGQSLNNADFQNNIRIGYLPINDYTLAPTLNNDGSWNQNTNLAIVRNPAVAAPGTSTGDASVLRGTRLLNGGSTSNTELYSFLNNIQSRGGTPLHNAINKVADYYSGPTGAVENPWLRDDGVGLSCRRSFNLLFSDGGWTAGTVAVPADQNYDNIPAAVDRIAQNPDGTPNPDIPPFRYQPGGDRTNAGVLSYVPYPSPGTGGLADLTARYYWHTDMSPLANAILPENGQPTFWQNMTTYTVGYQVQPTGGFLGDPDGAGPLLSPFLNFDQIERYQTLWQTTPLPAAAPAAPAWPTGNLLVSTNQAKIDDFVHAGYTGGGRSYSAKTADDVREIFVDILSSILNSSGNDAGVAVSSSGGNSNLAGSNKYEVSYNTRDNSGTITAIRLDARGNEIVPQEVAWSIGPRNYNPATRLIPLPADRNVFTMSGLSTPVELNGNFSLLPEDVRNAIKQGPDQARVKNDASFVNYLRGDDTALDHEDKLFRLRASELAAMVNPPSAYMGGDRDFAYDLDESGGVEGRAGYEGFTNRKRGYPGTLFVATNAGMAHVFNPDIGSELGAFMPRRSLKRMLNYAKKPYEFEYVLDGPISEIDVFDRRGAPTEPDRLWEAWRHVAVGTGGRGEPLVYAINSPFNPGAPSSGVSANRTPGKDDFLWETGPDLVNVADGSDVHMGYITNSARAGQTEDTSNALDTRGRWIVAVNNGHYNGVAGGEKAGLVVLDAHTGSVIRTIPLPPGYDAGRGLSGVTLLRSYDTNTRVVAAYAGDAKGQLWRFNLSGDPDTWKVEHDRPIFIEPNGRPIYGHPAWQEHPTGGGTGSAGFMVIFATGMALEEADIADQGPQAIYAIWDQMDVFGNVVPDPSADYVFPTVDNLVQQDVLPDTAVNFGDGSLFQIENNPIDWTTARGWVMPMGYIDAGERSIADVQNFGKKVIITSTVLQPPSTLESCNKSDLPVNYIYVLDAGCGCMEKSWSFDLNLDNRLDEYAVYRVESGGFSRGVEVTRYRTDKNGVAIVDPVDNTSIDLSDPERKMSTEWRDADRADEKAGESDFEKTAKKSKCVETRGSIIGTAAGAIQTGERCEPSDGWSRTQFQLSAPPKNE